MPDRPSDGTTAPSADLMRMTKAELASLLDHERSYWTAARAAMMATIDNLKRHVENLTAQADARDAEIHALTITHEALREQVKSTYIEERESDRAKGCRR